MTAFLPLRYLFYRLNEFYKTAPSLRACGTIWILVSLNELVLFGKHEWIEFLFGDDFSRRNWRLWLFALLHMAGIWLFLGRNADGIRNEFQKESADQRRKRGLFVVAYIFVSVTIWIIKVSFF